MHEVSQLLPLCVCQISSKSNIFQHKGAGEEKSGETTKHKLNEMVHQLCLQSQNLESSGTLEIETLIAV